MLTDYMWWLDTMENSVDASVQRVEDYIRKQWKRLMAATRNNTNDTRTSETTITRKPESGKNNKSLDVLNEKTWTWLSKGKSKIEAGSLLIPTQNNILMTNQTNHIINLCRKLAQKVYKTRYDWVSIWRKLKFELTKKWYMHNPESVLENDSHKLLWDFEKRTDH